MVLPSIPLWYIQQIMKLHPCKYTHITWKCWFHFFNKTDDHLKLYRSWWLHETEALQWGIEQDHHQVRFLWTKSREQLSPRCWSIHTIHQSIKPRTGRLKSACDGQCTVRSWCTDLFQCSLLWTSQAKLHWNSAATTSTIQKMDESHNKSSLVMKVWGTFLRKPAPKARVTLSWPLTLSLSMDCSSSGCSDLILETSWIQIKKLHLCFLTNKSKDWVGSKS